MTKLTLEEHLRRAFAWKLRIAESESRWERLVEAVSYRTPWPVERWEWRTPDGRWVRYWRRNGSLPA